MPESNKRSTSNICADPAVLLVSCYELGQQPLGTAAPAGFLGDHGFAPRQFDLAVEPLDATAVRTADIVGISVPMHTALRIGIEAAKRVRLLNDRCHIVFFGTYAALNAEYLLETVADSCLGDGPEHGLLDLALRMSRGQTLEAGSNSSHWQLSRGRGRPHGHSLPDRRGLPALENYVKLLYRGERRSVGSVTTTKGCKHLCRHCPIPPVYGGQFYALPIADVMADIRGLVEQGARHITFSDPDFLNGPSHALRMAQALHDEFPSLTFDFTAKVEHLLRHEKLLDTIRTLGCLFVVSAVESLSGRTLSALRKGHTAADVPRLIDLFRQLQLTLRPTFVPFTPWDTLDDYSDLLAMIEREDIVDHVDPIQLTIRLLVPPGSLLVESDEMRPYLEKLDKERLSWRWRHPDARMDRLQLDAAAYVDEASRRGDDALATFSELRKLARAAANPARLPAGVDTLAASTKDRAKPPRLSEDWFC